MILLFQLLYFLHYTSIVLPLKLFRTINSIFRQLTLGHSWPRIHVEQQKQNLDVLVSGVHKVSHTWSIYLGLVSWYYFSTCSLCTFCHNLCIFIICSCPRRYRHKISPLISLYPQLLFLVCCSTAKHRMALYLTTMYLYWIYIGKHIPAKPWNRRSPMWGGVGNGTKGSAC